MLKKLIGALGLLAIIVWFAVCGAGYTLSFFGVLSSGWFSKEWLIQHPIFDISLLILVLVGTIYIMGQVLDLLGFIRDEPEEEKLS